MFILGNFSFLERCVNKVNFCSCWCGIVKYDLPLTQSCFYFENRKLTCFCVQLHVLYMFVLWRIVVFCSGSWQKQKPCIPVPDWRSCDGAEMHRTHIWCHLFGVKSEDAAECRWPFSKQTLGRKDCTEVRSLALGPNLFMVCFKSNRKNTFLRLVYLVTKI